MTMTRSEHTRYIQSARWRARANKYLRKHGRRCAVCRRRDRIEVHHLSYGRAGAGKEPDRDLLALCRQHHQLAHQYEHSGMYGQPYTGRTLRKATEAMVRDATGDQLRTRIRAWLRRQWRTLTVRPEV